MTRVDEKEAGHSERMNLYLQGLTDAEIAKRQGVTRCTIGIWRRRNKLGVNISGASGQHVTAEQAAARLMMYNWGWSDQRIAREQKVHKTSIRAWRCQRGLAPNFASGVRERNKTSARPSQLLDQARQAIGRSLPPDLIDEAVSDLVMAVIEGRVDARNLQSSGKGVVNKIFRMFADKYRTSSLDEVVAGTDDLRIIDTIRDDRSTAWLEEMGASCT